MIAILLASTALFLIVVTVNAFAWFYVRLHFRLDLIEARLESAEENLKKATAPENPFEGYLPMPPPNRPPPQPGIATGTAQPRFGNPGIIHKGPPSCQTPPSQPPQQ